MLLIGTYINGVMFHKTLCVRNIYICLRMYLSIIFFSQMVAVEISKQIERGEVNNAFERALSASDLSLVMTACRAARGSVFAPQCRLRQHVLLALLQQLSTDMMHDTQLKCR